MKTFSEKLKDLRQQKNMTKKQMAKELNICYNSYLKYESGKYLPPIKILYRIAVYYKVSAEFLLEYEKFIL